MRKKTKEEFLLEFNESYDSENYELLSQYETAITKIEIRHKVCGNTYTVTPNKWLGGRRCPNCRFENVIKSRKITFEEANKRVLETTNKEFHLVSFNKTSSKATFKCNNCGKENSQIYNNFIERFPHCECNENRKHKLLKEIKKNQLLECCDKFGYELLSDYVDAKSHVKMKHLSCENVWKITPSNFKRGYGCPKCNQSKGEKEVELYLKNKNIEYIPQYKFDDCKSILPLPFDFYLNKLNICIEFQGEQHFKSIDFFGGYEEFKERQKRDKIKKDYCKLNNIQLIYLTYKDIGKVEKILKNKLI